MRHRRFIVLVSMILTSLGCQTVQALATAIGPTGTPRPTATLRPTRTPGPTATPLPTLAPMLILPPPALSPLRPEFAGDADLFPTATRYTLDVTVQFNPDDTAALTGRERIQYTNPLTQPLAVLYLMLWPNEPNQYFSQMTLDQVQVDGAPVPVHLEQAGLAARLDLAAPLAPGAVAQISTEFSVDAYSGIESQAARFGLTHGVLLAPTFYPLIPRLVDGTWQTLMAPPGGDTTNSDTAFYQWRVTAPADLAIVATGRVIQTTTAGGLQTQTLDTGPVRDLALVVGPLQLSQRDVDGITLNAYVLAEDASRAPKLLDYAAAQVANLDREVGAYPFTELDLVDAPGAFGGIEYPAVVFIGVVGGGSDFFERATVHEVGHQWFYSLIGDDQLLEPWLDEAAASYTEVLYAETAHGPSAAQQALAEFKGYLRSSDHPELPIGLPVGGYPTESEYGLLVYGKGALFFDALRQTLGDDQFFAFLHAYYQTYRYGFATTAGFQRVAEASCQCQLGDLFDLWVYKGGDVLK